MRHFFIARPVATLTRGMASSPRLTILVALSGTLDGAAPGLLGAVFGTINLAAVTAATDHHLTATPGAQKQSRRCRRGMIETAVATWTTAVIAGIVSLHACPARCGARRRCRTAKLRSAPCLPLNRRMLSRAVRSGVSRTRTAPLAAQTRFSNQKS